MSPTTPLKVMVCAVPLVVAVALEALLLLLGIHGRVAPAFFSTVAQIVPVVAVAAVIEILGGRRRHRGRVRRALVEALAYNLAGAEALALGAVASGSDSRLLAFAVGGYLILQLVVLVGVVDPDSGEGR